MRAIGQSNIIETYFNKLKYTQIIHDWWMKVIIPKPKNAPLYTLNILIEI